MQEALLGDNTTFRKCKYTMFHSQTYTKDANTLSLNHSQLNF